jgi:branched-chain amino acid transport system permease protein
VEQFFQQFINGLSVGAIYALIAVGYTMVYGVLQLINFAHGDIYMVGAMGGWWIAAKVRFFQHPSWIGFLLILLCSMVLCAALGFVIELVAYRPLRNQPRLTSLITAIGVSMFLEFGGQQFFGPNPQAFPSLIPGWQEHPTLVNFHGLTIDKVDVLIIGSALVLMALLRWIVMGTRAGMALRAVSYRFDVASLMGINVNRIVSFTFILGSALAAVAGVLFAVSKTSIDPLMGLLMGLKAFIAADLGGIGNIPGAVVGGFLLGITETFVKAYFPHGSQYSDGIAFVILITVLLVKPSGLLGSNRVEKV